jgi:hypothetical protein
MGGFPWGHYLQGILLTVQLKYIQIRGVASLEGIIYLVFYY